MKKNELEFHGAVIRCMTIAEIEAFSLDNEEPMQERLFHHCQVKKISAKTMRQEHELLKGGYRRQKLAVG